MRVTLNAALQVKLFSRPARRRRADRKTRKRRARFGLMPWLLLASLLVTGGCAAVLVGAGAGAGTYAYVKGELIRTYPAGYQSTLDACTSVIEDLGMTVLSKTTDGVQTTITAERKDGTPMTIAVKISGSDWTQVSVRTGFVGLWKKELSQQYHEYVAKRLNQ